MNENHTQMTEDFLAYARPLIQAELTPLYIAGLPHHLHEAPEVSVLFRKRKFSAPLHPVCRGAFLYGKSFDFTCILPETVL